MLEIVVPEAEYFNEATSEFIKTSKCVLSLEHSLVSISKWEASHCKPFFGREEKTEKDIRDYVKCMTLNKGVDDKVYDCLSVDNIKAIRDYIDAPMTATTFSNMQNTPPSRQVITSEVIYWSMIENGIPFECQKWHINRLLTLIRVCTIKNSPQKKMSKSEIWAMNSKLNASRRAAMHSKG